MTKQTKKKLYRSRRDKIFAGVIGGLGEYFDVDATILRLVLAVVVVFTGIFPGVVIYLIAWAIVPEEPTKKGEGIKIAKDSE